MSFYHCNPPASARDPRIRRAPAGVTLLYGIVAMGALCGFVSMAVDYGRVQLAKTELQRAADAAARYAATGLSNSTWLAKAQAAAAENLVDGSALSLLASDVEQGVWAGTPPTFTPGGGSPNAVRITARRTAARGNAVPLLFASLLGRNSCDVTVQVVATYNTGSPSGLIGLSSVSFGNNTFIGSYNSAVTTSPTQGSANSNAALGSNGPITAGNNSSLYGDVMLGPSATVSGLSISGSQINESSALQSPTVPSWSPGSNPGGAAQNFTVSGNQTLPGGTYWFTAMNFGNNQSLSFSGAATIILNGSPAFGNSDTISAYQRVPSNLKIYQIGSSDFGTTGDNNLTIVADIVAPNNAFKSKNNFVLQGHAIFKSIDLKNNANIFYDEAEGSASGGTSVTSVK